MRQLTAAKSSTRCLISAATGGRSNGGGAPPTTPSSYLRFSNFDRSEPSPSKLHLSTFGNSKLALYETKASNYKYGRRHIVRSSSVNLPKSPPSRKLHVAVVGWWVVTLTVAVANRVLQKLALVPMKNYPFFLAQLNSFVFVGVFFSVLHVRYYAGITTDDMLALPKLPFLVIGFLECVSSVCGMYAGAMLPGPAIPLLYQTFLVWQLLFSRLLLGRTYYLNQIMGCFLVAAGVVVAVSRGGASGSGMLSGVRPVWPALMIASSLFQAAASIFKESVFLDAPKHLKGKSLDLFVLNSFAAGFQALFTVAFLPVLANMEGLSLSQLPSYFASGVACFFNIGTKTTGCEGAPLLPILYIASNILFNVSILNLLKVSNAIVTSLAGRASVPIAVYILSQPLPYLPKGLRLSPLFHMGSMILVVGLVLYNFNFNLKSPEPQVP